MSRWLGGALPLATYNRDVYVHHASGGEQTRTLTVTWLRRSVAVAYTSRWRAPRWARGPIPDVPPCAGTWQDEVGCHKPGPHSCALIGGHRIHRCVCGAFMIQNWTVGRT